MGVTQDRPQVVATQVEPRIVQRRRDVRAEQERSLRRKLIAVAAVLCVLAAVVGVAMSPILDVDRVVVRGNFMLDAGLVVDASGVHEGDQLVTVDLAEVRARLNEHPLIAGSHVERVWPDTIRVQVVEEIPIVRVRAGESSAPLVVSRSGTVLDAAVFEGAALPEVELPNVDPLEVGDAVGDKIRPALSVFTDLAEPLRSELAVGAVTRNGSLSMELVDGSTIRFGQIEDMPAKLLAARTMLEQVQRDCPIDVIDVVEPTRVTVSRRGAC